MNNQNFNFTDPKVQRRFLSYKEARQIYGISESLLMDMATDAGALYHFGRRVLIDSEIFEDYIDSFRVPSPDRCQERRAQAILQRRREEQRKLHGVKS